MKRARVKFISNSKVDPLASSLGTRLAAEMRRDFRDVPKDEAIELTRKAIAQMYGRRKCWTSTPIG
jgi:hypothetical protein